MFKDIFLKINSIPFFKNIGLTFIVQGIGAILTFVLHIYLAKVLGLDNYGLFVYIMAIITPIGFIAGFGFNISLIKYINEYEVHNKNGLIKGLIKYVLGLTGLLSISLTAIAILISSFFLNEEFLIYLIAFGSIPFNTANSVFDSLLKAKKKYVISFVISGIIRSLAMLVLILICYILAIKLSIIVFLYVNLFISLLILILNFLVVKHNFHEVFKVTSKYRVKDWLKTSSPMLLSNVSFRILTYSDVIIIKAFLGDQYVGLYNLMSKSLMLLDMLTVSVNTIKGPDFAKYFAENNLIALKKDFFYSRNVLLILTLLFSVFLYIVLPIIFNYINYDFSTLIVPFTILMFSKWISAFSGSSGVLLNMINKQKLHMYITIVSVVIYLISGIVLTKYFGLVGISIATLFGYGFVNLIKHHYALLSFNSTMFSSIKNVIILK